MKLSVLWIYTFNDWPKLKSRRSKLLTNKAVMPTKKKKKKKKKPTWKLLRRLKHKFKGNIRMDIREIGDNVRSLLINVRIGIIIEPM